MRGYWGEIRDWRDGTTIVQKTHDADPALISKFRGRGILILRNPYDAILSKFHYLYGGHHGLASEEHFERCLWIWKSVDLNRNVCIHFRPVWQNFVEVEMKDWLEMALNWTSHGKLKDWFLVMHSLSRMRHNITTNTLFQLIPHLCTSFIMKEWKLTRKLNLIKYCNF